MRYFLFLFLYLTLMSSCGKSNDSNETSILSIQTEKNLKGAHLTKDDILILEIHYPVILKKIIVQQYLSPKDILVLHEIGINSETLIHLIKYTKSNYMLSTDEVVNLQLGGVPFEVINFMIES